MGKGTGTCQSRPALNMQGAGDSKETKTKVTPEEATIFFEQLSSIINQYPNTTIADIQKFNPEFAAEWDILLSKHYSGTLASILQKQLSKVLNIPIKNMSRAELIKKQELDEEQIKEDGFSMKAGLKGTFKSDDEKMWLNRPHQNCIECNKKITDNEPFHWASLGPVHGWGPYNKKGTCNNVSSNKTTKTYVSKPKKCVECGLEIDTFKEAYHSIDVEGKKAYVHGTALNGTTGTCTFGYKAYVTDTVDQISKDFVEGKLTSEQMLEYAEELKQEEQEFYQNLKEQEQILMKHIQEKKKKEKEKKKSTTTGGASKQDRIKSFEKMIYTLMDSTLDTTKEEWLQNNPDIAFYYEPYFKQFDAGTNLRDIIENVYQDIYKLED